MRGWTRGAALGIELFPGILHCRDRRELRVLEAAVDLLNPADVDVVNHVACSGIDTHRTARAVRVAPVGEDLAAAREVQVAVLLAHHIDDRRHAVPAADRKEARYALGAVCLPPFGDEGVVGGSIARR